MSGEKGGISFLGALLLLFIGLKLTDTIDWSWWWVLAPLWGPPALGLAVGLAWLLLYALFKGPRTLVRTMRESMAARRRRQRAHDAARAFRPRS